MVIMDMTPYDPAQVARLEARPGQHGAMMCFMIHVHDVCPTHVLPLMFFAEWAATKDEKDYYIEMAVDAGEQQFNGERDGVAIRTRDPGEDKLFRTALIENMQRKAAEGSIESSAMNLAILLEFFPKERMVAVRYAATLGVTPVVYEKLNDQMTM